MHTLNDENTIYQPLLDLECDLKIMSSIATITFFNGPDLKSSQTWLKERLSLICQANPWLTGRLVKDKKRHKNLLLAIPKTVSDEDTNAVIGHYDDKTAISLSGVSSEILFKKLHKSNLLVGPGYKLIGKDLRIAKFTLVPVANGQVALIVSIDHAVADGKKIESFFLYLLLRQITATHFELMASSFRPHVL